MPNLEKITKMRGVQGLHLEYEGGEPVSELPFAEVKTEQVLENVRALFKSYHEANRRVTDLSLGFEGGTLYLMSRFGVLMLVWLDEAARLDMVARACRGLVEEQPEFAQAVRKEKAAGDLNETQLLETFSDADLKLIEEEKKKYDEEIESKWRHVEDSIMHACVKVLGKAQAKKLYEKAKKGVHADEGVVPSLVVTKQLVEEVLAHVPHKGRRKQLHEELKLALPGV